MIVLLSTFSIILLGFFTLMAILILGMVKTIRTYDDTSEEIYIETYIQELEKFKNNNKSLK
jgi:hypothetical protein